MSQVESAPPNWVKSRRCEMQTCVEVSARPGRMAIRNSTAPQDQILFAAAAWRGFVAAVRSGAFDGR